ncbi:MAG: hypothetical protein K0U78_19780 [Actinomycetia bacterium]|nr:hypothetical protein [Actinomycetes bacterium]
MKLFVLKECPFCDKVKEKLVEYGQIDRFETIDVGEGYDGFLPEEVPVLQDKQVGTFKGEMLLVLLDKFYGNDKNNK